MMASRKPVIGLLGGVGSGKSTVAGELALLGCAVIDADRIGHELLSDPHVQKELRQRWGAAVFNSDGSVNRSALGALVFASQSELQKLNDIVHPLIGREIERRIGLAQDDPKVPALVLDAAVMLEAGWDRYCTDLVFVQPPPARSGPAGTG